MAEASLWPVVTGGLLTGLFTLGGIGVGLIASARRDAARERREARKRRADKFEELVAALYEFDHWLDRTRSRLLFDNKDIPETVSPFAKVQSISAVYFPQFSRLVLELDVVSSKYDAWLYQVQAKKASATQFNEIYEPYVKKREALLDALSEFARKEFQ
jgi:hypothetical protein